MEVCHETPTSQCLPWYSLCLERAGVISCVLSGGFVPETQDLLDMDSGDTLSQMTESPMLLSTDDLLKNPCYMGTAFPDENALVFWKCPRFLKKVLLALQFSFILKAKSCKLSQAGNRDCQWVLTRESTSGIKKTKKILISGLLQRRGERKR